VSDQDNVGSPVLANGGSSSDNTDLVARCEFRSDNLRQQLGV